MMLMVSIFCFSTPLVVSYAFHARRHADQKRLAWIGLLLSLLLLAPFTLAMTGSILNCLR
jgi:Na+-driven multidrug efflux pump